MTHRRKQSPRRHHPPRPVAIGECRPPANDRWAPTAPDVATDVEQRSRLPVAEIRHQGRQIRAGDDMNNYVSSIESRGQILRKSVARVPIRNLRGGYTSRPLSQKCPCLTAADIGVGASARRRLERLAAEAPPRFWARRRSGSPAGSATPRGVGYHFLAVPIVELLGDLKRFGRRPTKPRAAKLLQRGQVMQPGRACRLSSTATESGPVKPSAWATIACAFSRLGFAPPGRAAS